MDASGQHVLVVGSACSGSGMNMIVLNVYADWVKKLAGLQLVVQHAYSCENNKLKQKRLLTSPHPPDLLFANVSDLAAGVGVPVNGSDEVKVPNVDVFFPVSHSSLHPP